MHNARYPLGGSYSNAPYPLPSATAELNATLGLPKFTDQVPPPFTQKKGKAKSVIDVLKAVFVTMIEPFL